MSNRARLRKVLCLVRDRASSVLCRRCAGWFVHGARTASIPSVHDGSPHAANDGLVVERYATLLLLSVAGGMERSWFVTWTKTASVFTVIAFFST